MNQFTPDPLPPIKLISFPLEKAESTTCTPKKSGRWVFRSIGTETALKAGIALV